ncbi:MAG: hypothetical protein QXG05_08080 [Nitrososphaerota archaeon]
MTEEENTNQEPPSVEITPPMQQQEKQGFFSRIFRRKKYAIFRKVDRKTELVTFLNNRIATWELEDYVDLEDPTVEYQLREVGTDGKSGKLIWRIPRKKKAIESRPAYDRLIDDIKEVQEPIKKTAVALNSLRDVLADLFSLTAPPEQQAGTEQQTDDMGMMKDMLDKQAQLYQKMIEAMMTSMANSVTNFMFPWSVPQGWPFWAQFVTHPGARMGLRELTKDIVEDVTKTAGEAIQKGLGLGVQNVIKAPSMKEILEGAKK